MYVILKEEKNKQQNRTWFYKQLLDYFFKFQNSTFFQILVILILTQRFNS